MHARGRAYSQASFASEPIQLPIVPLNWFTPHKLHATAAREHAGADVRHRYGAVAAQRWRTEPRGP